MAFRVTLLRCAVFRDVALWASPDAVLQRVPPVGVEPTL